jgi:RNA 2',3'-cyclic 3'-phosphodiesterase
MSDAADFDRGPFPPLVRVFVAIDIPAAQKELAAGIASTLAAAQADVKWVKSDAIHLTLKFLGEIPRDVLDPLQEALGKELADFPDFAIKIEGMGQFPPKGTPRVIWLGITEGAPELANLAALIDKTIVALGFPGETRPWAAHLTLGRVNSPRHREELQKMLSTTTAPDSPPFPARKVILIRSQLQRSGPIYTRLAAWKLAANG